MSIFAGPNLGPCPNRWGPQAIVWPLLSPPTQGHRAYVARKKGRPPLSALGVSPPCRGPPAVCGAHLSPWAVPTTGVRQVPGDHGNGPDTKRLRVQKEGTFYLQCRAEQPPSAGAVLHIALLPPINSVSKAPRNKITPASASGTHPIWEARRLPTGSCPQAGRHPPASCSLRFLRMDEPAKRPGVATLPPL